MGCNLNNIATATSMFESIVIFQIDFCLEIYYNNIFIFKKLFLILVR